MNTQPQTLNLTTQLSRATSLGQPRCRNALDPELVAQVIGYGLMWLGMILFAVAAVAMVMSRLL